MNTNSNLAILEYANGGLNGGAELDEAAKTHMTEHNEKDYAKAVKAVITEARAAVAEDVKEYKNRVRSYQSHFKINEAEAHRRVAEHDPKMKALYEADPMGPTMIVGQVEPPAVADVTTKPWTPPVHQPIAVIAVANILFGLPRDEFMYITLDQAREALAPYPDLLQRACSEKMDYYARMGIKILGLPGFSSENYAAGFEWARKQYPALAALYSVGKLTSRSLRELLPQILVTD